MTQDSLATAHQVRPKPQQRAGYSVREIANQYGVSEPFVRLEIKRGNLRASKLGRGS
jgi:transposase